MPDLATAAEALIRPRLKGFVPQLGFILGSGLAPLIQKMEVLERIAYRELPGFFSSTVVGHKGEFVFGHLAGVPVMAMNGRVHLYEGASPAQLMAPLRLMRRFGIESLLLTNATGSLKPHLLPGSLVLIQDQINMTGVNVLVGENDAEYGPRFQGMENAYHPAYRKIFKDTAVSLNIPLHEGTYVGVMGPSYETPAEIRFFGSIGGDIVGMSTVQEVIAARHCGLKVLGLSLVSNLGAGLSSQLVNHEEVVSVANAAGHTMATLIEAVLVANAGFPEV
jgi:inosine/guanosine/xanthosine phosphorylase family protein